MIKKLRSILHRALKRTRVRTIKHTFSFATVAVLSLVAAVLLTDDTSYIRLDTPAEAVSAGERFTVAVYAGAHVSVNAIDVTVQFPDDLVTVTGIDTGESVISLWTFDPYVEGNKVILQGGTFRRGFVGEHLVAHINFEAKKDGQAEFSVSETTLLAGDGSGNEVANVNDTDILVVAVGEQGVLEADVAIVFQTDINGDGEVSFSDVQTFVTAWHQGRWIYDFNADSRMNFTDFAIILADTFLR